MKVLIYEWSSYYQYDLYQIFREMKIDWDCFRWKFEDKNVDDMFLEWVHDNISFRQYDALLSVNYFPLLSQVCMENGIRYIAWCYDNPLNVINIEQTLGNPCNYVFLYDRIQYESYKKKGFDTVYHQLLGVNGTRYSKLQVTKEDRNRFSCDISFIGQLYQNRLYEILNPLDDYLKGYIDALMKLQSPVYGFFMLGEAVTDQLIESMNMRYREIQPNTSFFLTKEALLFAMGCELTRRDRMVLLGVLGKKYHTDLYSADDDSLLSTVRKQGTLDYVSEMPKLFACSKINLNPSLRIIQSGIPQRAFDVMGAGGFLLSNYQAELDEIFVDGKDMVLYESYEDAIEKTDFYMRNNHLREDIARNGRIKVLGEHTLQKRFKEILRITFDKLEKQE